jgi:gamma-glutamyltranspeptidase/glutathione hydrolase
MRKTSPGLWPKDVLAQRMRDDLRFEKFHPGVESEKGVISCSAYGIAAEVGAEVLRMGGNAMDAGLATALTQVVFSCGDYVSYAGVFQAIYYDAKQGKVHSIDGGWNTPKNEADPLSIPAMNVPGNGRTALVPGFMAAVEACIKRFGTLPLADLLEPAIYFAEEGFQLEKMGKHIEERTELLGRFPETRALFFKPDGTTYKAGDWFRQPRLAGTLRQLAAQGADYMYRGEWARHFVATVQAAGGKITLEDMANYRARIAEPRRTRLFGAEACTNPDPSYGGTETLIGLKALEVDNSARLGHLADNGRALLRFCQALGYMYEFSSTLAFAAPAADRERRRKAVFGDAFDGNDPLSEQNIRLYWKAVDEGRFTPECMSVPASTHSDCITIIDRQGNMLCMTHSANQAIFGNTGLSVDGIMITDSASFLQPQMAAGVPGARLLPITSPPVMFCRDGKPFFAISSIGMGLVQKNICHAHNVLAFGMDVVQAQHAPSIMAPDFFAAMVGSGPDPAVFVDETQFRPEVLAEARRLGLKLKDCMQCHWIADVNGGPTLEGFTVGVQRKDNRNLAVGVNWMNSKAVAE